MNENPYLPPKAVPGDPEKPAWLPTFLPPFASATLITPVAYFFFAGIGGWPSFMFRLAFVASLVVCSFTSAHLLTFYRGANWLVRSILAPWICFPLLLVVDVGLQLAT